MFKRISPRDVGVATAILAGLSVQFYAHGCGLLLTSDSREYLAAAVAFSTNGSLRLSDGSPYLFWPPLYPLILSALPNPIGFMSILHLVLSALVGWQSYRLAKDYLEMPALRLTLVVLTSCGLHLLLISTFLWSELFFLVLLMVFIEQVEKGQSSRRHLAFAMLAGWLMCLQRNAGIFVVLASTIWFVSQYRSPRDVYRSLLFIIVTASGWMIWNGYVFFISPSSGGMRELQFFASVLFNLEGLAIAAAKSFIPVEGSVAVIAFLVAAGITTWLIVTDLRTDKRLQHAVIIVIVYIAGMAMLFELDPADGDRYLAVITPVILVCVLRAGQNLLLRQTPTRQLVLGVLIALWMVYPLARSWKNAAQWHQSSCVYPKTSQIK